MPSRACALPCSSAWRFDARVPQLISPTSQHPDSTAYPPHPCLHRLYEAGADETVNLLGTQLATPQAGALFAAVGCATVSLALLVQRSLFPIQCVLGGGRGLLVG